MSAPDPATAAQYKVLAEQAAAIALAEYDPKITQLERALSRLSGATSDEGGKSISPVSKWLAGLAATITGGIIMAGLLWVGTSMTDMQQTLARIDERQKAQAVQQDSRFTDFERRISQLERFHNPGSGAQRPD